MSALAVAPPVWAPGRLFEVSPGAPPTESLGRHLAAVGPRPEGGDWLLGELERSGLRGRGGACVPAALKWRAMAERARRRPVVVVNASEGEPLSAKDRTLVTRRPHLVLDGASLAAEAVGAAETVVYLSRRARDAAQAMGRALAERCAAGLREPSITMVTTPHRYVAGESSAVVSRINGGPAKPSFGPPHPSESGVGGRPTLVHNAETLAHAALIARFGAAWFRECGTVSSPGTALLTISGAVRRPGVYELDLSGSLIGAVARAGGTASAAGGALLGGYFGRWISVAELNNLPLDCSELGAAAELSLGCGILSVLPAEGCGVAEAARIAAFMAGESARQCGPCVFGLRALAGTMGRLAASRATAADADRVAALAEAVRGRGACHHPDGAVGNAASALATFADHLAGAHLRGVPCPGSRLAGIPQPPRHRGRWR